MSPQKWRPSSSQEAGSDLIQGVQLRWLRLAAPQGTAAARSAGGEAARGEALATWNKSRSHRGDQWDGSGTILGTEIAKNELVHVVVMM